MRRSGLDECRVSRARTAVRPNELGIGDDGRHNGVVSPAIGICAAVMGYHLVRYGLLGHVGAFAAADAVRYPRRSRVVVRSPRGLEVGEVLSEPNDGPRAAAADGLILRRMSVQDDLLEARLQRRRHEAFDACRRLLAEAAVSATLVDVEHLFDGEGLLFYFLGDPPTEAREITARLAETYEAAVEFRRFAEKLVDGCGPGCGTEMADGNGGCATCTSCAVAGACATKPLRK